MSRRKCECGCGGPAPIAKMTNKKWGAVKGKPVRFIHGHHNRRPIPKIAKEDLAWLAGLLEGEGAFCVAKKPRRPKTGRPWTQVTARVSVGMTDEDVIARAAALVGRNYCTGKVYSKKTGKRMYVLYVSSRSAEELMRLLYKHLGSRRRSQIDKTSERVSEAKKKQPSWPRKIGGNKKS